MLWRDATEYATRAKHARVCGLEEKDNASISIINLLGEKVYTQALANEKKGMHKTIIDVSNYTNGIYFVTLTSNTKVSQKKFIVLK